MSFSGAAVSAGQLLALADDAPLVIAHNVLADGTGQRWSAGGTAGGTDQSDPDFPARFAYDGQLHFGTASAGGSGTVFYYTWEWASSVVFDSVVIRVISDAEPTSVVLATSAAGTFSSPTTHWTWTAPGADARLVGLSGTQYTGTGFGRLVLTYGTSVAAPQIGEIYIGQRRQLSRRPDQGGGYDDEPHGVDVDVFRARGRATKIYQHAGGFSDFSGAFTPTGADSHGLDDLATLRAIATDSDYLTEPVAWIDKPSSAPEFACVGVLSLGQGGLVAPYQDWQLRRVDFEFSESTPFARVDNCVEAD